MARQATDHVDTATAVGTRLRTARRAAGLRQADLTFPGCTTGYISRIENGERVPSLQVIRRLAARLGLSEAWLARGTTELDPERELVDAELHLRFDELECAETRYRALLSGDHPPSVRARAEAGLGHLAARRGQHADAIEHLERAAAIEPSTTDPSAAETLGRAHAALGNDLEALAIFKRRFDQALEDDEALEIVRFGLPLANALIDALHFGAATSTLASVIGAIPNADATTLARVRWSQARLYSLRGDTEAARRQAIAAVTLLETSEHRQQYARAHHLLAFVELDAGHPEEALALAERGLELLRDDATEYDQATFEIERARAFVQLGRLDEAASIAMGAAARFSSLHPVDFGRTYTELASAFLAQGDRERAGELYELAIELLEPRPTRFLAEAYARYGGYLELAGDTTGALVAYRNSANLATQLPTLASRA
jgi:tetratricopeptide (TPR) repeat protein